MNRSIPILIIVIMTINFLTGCIENEDEWGGEGDIAIILSFSNTTMNISGRIIVNYSLINNGSTNLRVISLNEFLYYSLIRVRDENDNPVSEAIDYSLPPPSHVKKMVELYPGETQSIEVEFSRYYYEISGNNSYFIYGGYYSYDDISVSEDHWVGHIITNSTRIFVE